MPSLIERVITCGWCGRDRPLGADYKLFGRKGTIYLCCEDCRDRLYESRGWLSVLGKESKNKQEEK